MKLLPLLPDSIYQLWDDLDDFKPHDMVGANLHLMKSLAQWLRADYAYLIGGVRVANGELAEKDPMNGWRTRVVEPYQLPPTYNAEFDYLMEHQELAETVSLATVEITKQAGTFRVRQLRELVDPERLAQSENFRKYDLPYGLSDRLYVVTPINQDAESYFCFELAGSDQQFSAEDANLVGIVLRGIRWFQRRLFLSHGLLVGDSMLTRMERSVTLLLLTEMSEKEIAAQIGRARSTTHNYITGIYRKFGVQGRAGLMAVWLA